MLRVRASMLAVLVLPIVLGLTGATARAAAPFQVNAEATAFAPVTRLLQQTIADEHMAGGSAIIYHDGAVVYRAAFGHADREANRPLQTDSLIRIASMSKSITSAVVMQLHERDVLDLDDPVSDYIPAFGRTRVLVTTRTGYRTTGAENTLTVRHLLNHTAGITYNFFDRPPMSTRYRQAGIPNGMIATDRTLAEATERLARLPLLFEPGTDFSYGLAADVLGRVIEIATGQPLEAVYAEQIFEPLGMDDTFFCVPPERWQRVARIYVPDDFGGLRPVGDGETVRVGRFRFTPGYPQDGRCDYASGGAGVVTTLDDFGRFLRMLANDGELEGERLLEAESVQQMTQDQLPPGVAAGTFGQSFGYGLGIVHEADGAVPPPGTVYWGGIFGTHFFVDPHNDLIAIVMTQVYPMHADNFRPRFQRAVYESLGIRP